MEVLKRNLRLLKNTRCNRNRKVDKIHERKSLQIGNEITENTMRVIEIMDKGPEEVGNEVIKNEERASKLTNNKMSED